MTRVVMRGTKRKHEIKHYSSSRRERMRRPGHHFIGYGRAWWKRHVG